MTRAGYNTNWMWRLWRAECDAARARANLAGMTPEEYIKCLREAALIDVDLVDRDVCHGHHSEACSLPHSADEDGPSSDLFARD